MPIQESVIAALQAGLRLPGGVQELEAMGLRPATISALESMRLSNLRGRNVLKINVDHAALTGSLCLSAATTMIQRGASNAMLLSVLGLTRNEIAAQRAALGIPAPVGRTPMPMLDIRHRILAVYDANASLARAERLIATHDAVSMYTLAQIWAIVA